VLKIIGKWLMAVGNVSLKVFQNKPVYLQEEGAQLLLK
jgi:hypothetical protein